MDDANRNHAPAAGPVFAARLHPHRSLSPRGFLIVMAAIGLSAFATGFVFWLLGAWPVVGFLGLDVLLVYVAFRLNFRAARACEIVELRPDLLIVRKVAADGAMTEYRFNPYWVRLEVDRHEEFGITGMRLASHGQRLPLAGDIGPAERAVFADALQAALRAARAAPMP